MVNHGELPSERSDHYHTKWDEISTEIEVPGLEGAKDVTLKGAARRSLVPFGQAEMVGNRPLVPSGITPSLTIVSSS